MVMSDILNQLFVFLGIGGIGGFLIGYTVKKILKVFAVIVGIFILSLTYLISVEAIKINWDKLVATALNVGQQTAGFLCNLGAFLPLSGSFFIGFTLGIVKG
jgi:uncharacterized membrane protein (Fun14 family)